MPTRLIRDALLDSARLGPLNCETRWLFIAILLLADDLGIFECNETVLARRADIRLDHVGASVRALQEADLIRVYQTEGKTYGFVPRFRQRFRLRQLKHPIPPSAMLSDDHDAALKINDLRKKGPSNGGHVPVKRPSFDRLGEGEGEGEGVSSPSTVASAPVSPAPKPEKTKRSKRAPTVFDWPIPTDLKTWAREECPLVDIVAETKAFRDHEFTPARSDWPATWRNWIRREQKRLAAEQRRGSGAAAETPKMRAERLRAAEISSYGVRPDPSAPVQPVTFDLETQPHAALDRD